LTTPLMVIRTAPKSAVGQPLASTGAEPSQGAEGDPNARACLTTSTKAKERDQSVSGSRFTPMGAAALMRKRDSRVSNRMRRFIFFFMRSPVETNKQGVR